MRTAACAALVLCTCTAAYAAQATRRYDLPSEISYPEGIAYDSRARAFFVAASSTGRIARIDERTGLSQLIETGLAQQIGDVFPGVLGLKLDRRGRLWMAGGRTGKAYVVDPRTGALLQSIAMPGRAQGLINDVAFAGKKAFFTDTLRPVLWSVDAGSAIPAVAEPWMDFEGTALAYTQGPNLNGLVATPDGKALLTVQMNKGLLFKIDIATRKMMRIDLQGEAVTGADGLVLKGRTLYVIRQPEAEIVTIRLSRDMTSGEVVARARPAGLLRPAAGIPTDQGLLVVSTQFDKRATNDPQLPFFVQLVSFAELERRSPAAATGIGNLP